MKYILAMAVLLLGHISNAQLADPRRVAAECMRQMSLGICYAKPDKSKFKPGQTLLLSGAGRVSVSAYMDYLNLYNPKNPNDPAMCAKALKYMNEEPGSEHDKIARAMWTPQLLGTTQK